MDWGLYRFYPLPEKKLAIMSTSRGCNQACTFCSQQVFWKRSWRARSPMSMISELEMLRDRFDVGVVMFSDENPTLDPVRWHRILDLLIAREVGTDILMETRVDDVLRDEALIPRYREANIDQDYNLVAPVVKPKKMTTDELMTQIVECYRRFYMGKLKTVPSMSKFKRDYFMVTMRLPMENSYLKQFMGGLGGMPAEVRSMLADMGLDQ